MSNYYGRHVMNDARPVSLQLLANQELACLPARLGRQPTLAYSITTSSQKQIASEVFETTMSVHANVA